MLGGSGQGEQIAANKVHGVRAALCNDLYTARLSRPHNDANVLSIGARIVACRAGRGDPAASGSRHRSRAAATSAASTRSPPSSTRSRRADDARPLGDETDPEIADIIRREVERQNTTIQLIASENFTSPAVLEAQGSVLTNKYSEGYPAKRYYGGNFVVDEAEELARNRACELFGAEHANVQPHSGANANRPRSWRCSSRATR